jgi:beta-aspartyl-peptidase (threonine type)
MTKRQRASLEDALSHGYALLNAGGSGLAAVECAIRALEQSGLFNAGVGSARQLDGGQRMDASIMEGRGLQAGAVASIEGIRHPIAAARLVLEQTHHVLLAGKPASRFARHFGLEAVPFAARARSVTTLGSRGLTAERTKELYNEMMRRRRRSLETVGAVALDAAGTVAAGASTGGIAVMLPGRVGDTPLIGCGVYADNDGGAVSMTGIGESIIRLAVAKEIVDRLVAREAPSVAVTRVLKRLMARIQGSAGALVLSAAGRLAIRHTTPHMAAGYWNGKGRPVVAGRFR